ncbi:dephospho-CoA kinase [Colwellia sp. M166]|jgi:dephospho-CoA kinase|uniref:dephospho-CoA kinase n=1 Tax=Colwellia sp. M166 TaxID=2583805 RepID=UPI00211E1749|nr:dephospho-CoA kinase [Colwellia sp. M166]UUO24150.1 dephospho-CoA kinase [Colwellia sp. M166]|tara:strand:+ start:1620 stop:2231 length:612 start_codon:yes stop_codon:yes gene_type:complete
MSEFIVGLTGGIGSGKTTVTDIFHQLGIDIIDADIAARIVVAPGSTALLTISNYFGSEYIDHQGQLNRAKLRSRIFTVAEDKTWLNNLLHPLIRQEILTQISLAKSRYCILVAPLLLENKLNKLVNRVLVVDVDEKTQIARTVARDPSSAEEVKRIIASQMPRAQRLSLADDIISNHNISLKTLRQQVGNLDKKYQKMLSNSL